MRIAVFAMVAGVTLFGGTAAHAQAADGRPAPGFAGSTTVDVAIGGGARIRTDVLTISAQRDPFVDPQGAMRHRFASSMIDFYPIAGSGLRLSGGLRFLAVTNFLRDAEQATRGLLLCPQHPGGGTGTVNTGFARHTPAATVGYSEHIGRAVFGFEMGSLLGTANSNLPQSFSRASNRQTGGINPVASLAFALKF